LAARAGFSRVRFRFAWLRLRQAQPPGFDRLSLNRQAQPPGFDKLSHQGETGPLQSLAGRGIFLMKQLSDVLRFEDQGRKVEMVFYL
jgi:anti-sigma regulatory factor (Ser/Thr protein kinase)